MKSMSPRVSEKAHEFFTANFRTANSGAEYGLEAFATALYPRIMHELKGRFNKNELFLILDVFNATALTAQIAGQHLIMNCVDGMELDGLDKKWHIDRDSFTNTLKNLSIMEKACLEIWAAGFWYCGDPDKELNIHLRVAPLVVDVELVDIFCSEAAHSGVSYADITHYIETIQTGRPMSKNDTAAGAFMGREYTFWNPVRHLDYNWFLNHQDEIEKIMEE